ncbi:MAG: molecular chaperone DnaJ [Candidatus Margulisbacteria bacterium]|nr:molecular chaperone DnaJ [Candidatus Margulisiibacteriota bacterium]
MSSKDYYAVLGINKNATDAEIKSAFRSLARKYHPDVNKDHTSQEKFKEINEAYQVLSDADKRRKYDQFGTVDGFDFGSAGFGGAGFSGFGDIFGNLGDIFEEFGFGGFGDAFGGRGASRSRSSGQTARKGEDIRVDASITLEEVANGVEKEIHVRHLDTCDHCAGTGSRSKKSAQSCQTCGGRGEVRQTRQSILGTISQVTPCPACHGEGKVVTDPCTNCSGSGRMAKSKTLKVKIPAGVETGSKLRVSGEGNVGQRGAQHGDLYVYIEVKKHALYERDGDDIHSKHIVSFSQAALGDEMDIQTLYGTIKLKVPAATQSHTVFRLKGKGIQHLQHHGQGDHYVTIIVETPKTLSNDEKTIYEYLAYLRKEKNSLAKGNIKEKIKKLFK